CLIDDFFPTGVEDTDMQMSADKGDDYQITTHVQKIFSRSNTHQVEVPLAHLLHDETFALVWCARGSRRSVYRRLPDLLSGKRSICCSFQGPSYRAARCR